MHKRFPLTIITPVRNGGAYFRRTLEAISAQTCKDFEYIVLDAVSTDDTPALIEEYRSVITYTHSQPDKGAVDAFNIGIKMARGDHIAFLSADDWLEPTAVERIVAAVKANPDAEVISFGLAEWHEKPGGEHRFLAAYRDPDDGTFDIRNALYSPCISRCFSRALYLHHGLYAFEDYGHFSDRELQLRFALHHPKKVVITEVLYHFRKHEASATGNAAAETILKSMACNRRIAQKYLTTGLLSAKQKKALVKWYGFAWVREMYFLHRTGQRKPLTALFAQGMKLHPTACLAAVIFPSMPKAYRGQERPLKRA